MASAEAATGTAVCSGKDVSAAKSTAPTYSTLRTGIIRLTPESMKCKLYCSGASCKYCNADAWPAEQQALRGLYSSWITDDILAMARPTRASFEEYSLLDQFKLHNIRTVINLQCAGEHAFCGPPPMRSGFTYDPEEHLMNNKIYYYNFAIPDFEPGSVMTLLNVVKVIWFARKHGKVAIHCHAGLGRTGTLIASYLVWSTGRGAIEAVDTVRRARPKSVQSLRQVDVVVEMERTLRSLVTALPHHCSALSTHCSERRRRQSVLADAAPSSAQTANHRPLPLADILRNQRAALPNDEARKYSHLPKLLFLVCDRLLRMVFTTDGVRYAMRPSTQQSWARDVWDEEEVDDDVHAHITERGGGERGHNVRNCTFGVLCVEWRHAHTHKGRQQMHYILNRFVRLAVFPYDTDQALTACFRKLSLIEVEREVDALDGAQLVSLLNACMESVQRPYASNATLCRAMEWFAPRTPPEVERRRGSESLSTIASSAKMVQKRTEVSLRGNQFTASNKTDDTAECERVDLNEDWHCMVFHLLNVLSYLADDSYDMLAELVTYWLTGTSAVDVRSAVYCHMRELFARNMRQQDRQLRRRNAANNREAGGWQQRPRGGRHILTPLAPTADTQSLNGAE